MRYLAVILPLLTLLSACSSQPTPPVAATPSDSPVQGGFCLSRNIRASCKTVILPLTQIPRVLLTNGA